MRDILETYNLTLDNYLNILVSFLVLVYLFPPSVLFFLKNNNETCEVLTAVLLKLKVLCDMILCCRKLLS